MQKRPSKLYLGERSVEKPYELNGFLQGAVSNYSKSVARAAFADGTVLFDRSAYPPIQANASLEEIETFAEGFWK